MTPTPIWGRCECGEPLTLECEKDHGACVECMRRAAEAA